MYTKQYSILMRCSASARDHNLSVHRNEGQLQRAAVIHQSSVNVLTWDFKNGANTTYQLLSKSQSDQKRTVIQAEWCVIGGKLTVILLCRDGMQIYDESGADVHFWNILQFVQDEDTQARCMTTIKDNELAIGTNKGTILIFRMGPQCTDASLTNTVNTDHHGAIACLSAAGTYLASGGDDGRVSTYNVNAPFTKVHTFDPYRSSVTAVNVWKTWVVSAYGSGHLRLFDNKSGQILAEVTAHAKWITAMDLAESTGLLLTVSEDTFVRVWQLTPSDEGVLSHKFSESIIDLRLCGGRFLDSKGKKFAVTGFESEEIICFSS